MKTLFKKTFTLSAAVFLTGFFFVLSTPRVRSQEPSVEGARAVLVQLAELNKKQALQTEAAQKLFTGELQDLKASSLGSLTEAPDKVLLTGQDQAVGRFQGTAGNGKRIVDIYFYLKRFEKDWMISAGRAMTLPVYMEKLYALLKAKPDLTEEEKSDLGNLRLTFATDRELIAWFSENRQSLEKLSALLSSGTVKSPVYVDPGGVNRSAEAAELQKLNLISANIEANGNIHLVIGGVNNKVVGFLYSPSGKAPEINLEDYMWVEEVAPNWYLFRTT